MYNINNRILKYKYWYINNLLWFYIEEEKKKFFENYADCSKWKDNKIIESISKEYMLNVVIIDAAKSNIEIIKTSNNPNATIILARQNGRFLTWFHEDESNTTISSE